MSAAFPPNRSSKTLFSSLQSHTFSSDSSAPSNWVELTDFYHPILDSLLHPISALNTNLPHLDPYNMFGGKSFNPATDIPDLRGKVILVTGGWAVFIHGCLCTH